MTSSAPPPPGPTPPPQDPAAGSALLREMRWWDIGAVLVRERDLFPDDAWSRGMFWSELAHARGPGATRRYVVAEVGGELVGYAGLAVSGDLADVQTIAVVRAYWGTGLGARLLTDLLRYATAAECAEVMLEVRVDNTRAQRLYERFGFSPLGIRRGYYQPGNVDALVMRLFLRGAADEETGEETGDGAPHRAEGRGGGPGATSPTALKAWEAPPGGAHPTLGTPPLPERQGRPPQDEGATDSSAASCPLPHPAALSGDAPSRTHHQGPDAHA